MGGWFENYPTCLTLNRNRCWDKNSRAKGVPCLMVRALGISIELGLYLKKLLFVICHVSSHFTKKLMELNKCDGRTSMKNN